jgi:hypothetical protein
MLPVSVSESSLEAFSLKLLPQEFNFLFFGFTAQTNVCSALAVTHSLSQQNHFKQRTCGQQCHFS